MGSGMGGLGVELDSLPLQIEREDFTRARASKPPDAREKRGWQLSLLQSRAWSFAFLARFARRIKKKERLLIV